MKLGEKIRYLREVEGSLRGLDRAMTQQELVRAIRDARGAAMSQSYLSQIESGARPHLTNTTRLLLARFFKVHPGYLVDDPEGYHAELLSEARMLHTRIHEDKLDLWLISGAEKFRRDPELRRALLTAAQHEDTRRCLLLLAAILETPSLADRLLEVLRPELAPRKKSLALVNGAEPIRQTGTSVDPHAGGVPDKVGAAPQRNGGGTVATNGRRPRTAIGKKERR
jgi:transcriptional regulator with XRE-family HTH domain